MNPELSRQATGSLPSARAKAVTAATVASDVARPRTTSTSFMTGTGLKKCRPAKRSGLFVAAAISVIVSDDVFEQKIVSGPHSASRAL